LFKKERIRARSFGKKNTRRDKRKNKRKKNEAFSFGCFFSFLSEERVEERSEGRNEDLKFQFPSKKLRGIEIKKLKKIYLANSEKKPETSEINGISESPNQLSKAHNRPNKIAPVKRV
jgi:hypothetical protein